MRFSSRPAKPDAVAAERRARALAAVAIARRGESSSRSPSSGATIPSLRVPERLPVKQKETSETEHDLIAADDGATKPWEVNLGDRDDEYEAPQLTLSGPTPRLAEEHHPLTASTDLAEASHGEHSTAGLSCASKDDLDQEDDEPIVIPPELLAPPSQHWLMNGGSNRSSSRSSSVGDPSGGGGSPRSRSPADALGDEIATLLDGMRSRACERDAAFVALEEQRDAAVAEAAASKAKVSALEKQLESSRREVAILRHVDDEKNNKSRGGSEGRQRDLEERLRLALLEVEAERQCREELQDSLAVTREALEHERNAAREATMTSSSVPVGKDTFEIGVQTAALPLTDSGARRLVSREERFSIGMWAQRQATTGAQPPWFAVAGLGLGVLQTTLTIATR